MDVRYHRSAERRAMRGFVLSLVVLLGGVVAASLLMSFANVWLAKDGAAEPEWHLPGTVEDSYHP